MSPPDDQGKKPRNPWDRGDSRQSGGRNPWGGTGGGGHGSEPPPELDELLRRARQNLHDVLPGGMDGGGLFGLLILAAAVLWLASGLYIITPGENGVIQRFGAYSRTQTSEGLGFHLPWPVEKLTKVSVSEVRSTEVGFRQGDRSSRGGYTQRQDVPEESLMLTSDRNIISIDLVVQWNIKSAEDYLFNIADPDSTIKKVAESAIREVVGQTEMFPIITTNREQVAQRTRDLMVKMLDQYKSGVNISNVLIQEAEVHPDVQEAFQDVQSAKQDASKVENDAGVYRQNLLPNAQGQAIKIKQDADAYKAKVTAIATGDAARFNAMYTAYLAGPDVTKRRMYIETMEDVLKSAQKIIIQNGGKGSESVVPYMSLDGLKPAAGGSDDSSNSNR